MIKVVLATIILYPYVGYIWGLLSVFGLILTIFFILGAVFKPQKVTFKPKNLVINYDKPKTVIHKRSTYSQLHETIFAMIKEYVPVELLKLNQQVVVDEKVDKFLVILVDCLHLLANHPLYESLCVNFLSVLETHIKQYQHYKDEFQGSLSSNEEPRHLDDFNEYSTETDNESIIWSANLDKLQEQIILKMRASDTLHPSVGRGIEIEQQYLRGVANQVIHFNESYSKTFPSSPSKILQVAIREWVVCKALWPLINKVSNPDTVNSYLLEKANRRLVVQKAVKNFRALIEADFTMFPPPFLVSGAFPQTIFEKHRYGINVQKYLKKAISLIDLNVIRYEVLRELKKRNEELAEMNGVNNFDEIDDYNKYLRQLEFTLSKIEKKISILNGNKESIIPGLKGKDSKTPLVQSQLKDDLSLSMVLEKYYASGEESGAMQSTSLFYFIDYLGKRKDSAKCMNQLRFWASAEKYRRLVWRINVGIVTDSTQVYHEYPDKAEQFSGEAMIRMQREALKLYNSYISPELPPNLCVCVTQPTLEIFQRFVGPLINHNSQPLQHDDYLCVIKAQSETVNSLEGVFNDFQNSESFFKWASESQTSKIINKDQSLQNTKLDVKSGLLKSLMKELQAICVKVIGKGGEKKPNDIQKHESILITLEDVIIVDPADTVAVELEKSPVKDEEEDELDLQPPGEFKNNTSKISQVEAEIQSLIYQIECLDYLNVFVNKTKLDIEYQMMMLHILEQTKELLGYEVGELTRQRAKYESQEQRELLMQNQCIVRIEEDDSDPEVNLSGKRVTYYLIHIVQGNGELGWTVKRRYSDFDALHQKLKEEFSFVSEFDLPQKTSGLWPNRAKNEIRSGRMKALEKYLQRLIDNHEVSKSDHLRNFLASSYKPDKKKLFSFDPEQPTMKKTQQKWAKTISTLTTMKIPEQASLKMKSFLESAKKRSSGNRDSQAADLDYNPVTVSPATDSATTGAFSSPGGIVTSPLAHEEVVSASDDEQSLESRNDFEDHINDHLETLPTNALLQASLNLLMQIFQFKDQPQWLKENTATMILQQYFTDQGPLEVKLHRLLKSQISDENLCRLIKRFKEITTSPELLLQSNISSSQSLRIETKQKFLASFAGIFTRPLGGESSYHGVSKMLDLLQNETLNKHLIFTLLDSSLHLIFQNIMFEKK
ncbi:Intermediate filament protein [Boothiomyces sp. JEL0838]|nr:Intermediate filament protein [Boothiomyces sp. JEL0838]